MLQRELLAALQELESFTDLRGSRLETSILAVAMKDSSKTIQALIEDLASLRRKIGNLEKSETEGKKIEDTLKESEQRLDTLFRKSPIPAFTWQKREGDFLLADYNLAAERMTAGKVRDFLGTSAKELYQDQPQVLEGLKQCSAEHPAFRQDLVSQHFAPGKFLSVHYAFIAPDLIIVHIEDLTDHRLVEEKLRKSEDKFRKAFYTSPDSVNINRLEDGMYISINPGFSRITGYTEEEIIGKTSIEYNIWNNLEDRNRLVEGLKRDRRATNLEADFRMKNGEIRHGLMSASIIDLDGVPHILNITRDITDRKQAERALRESEKKYKWLTEKMLDVVFITDLNLRTLYVSPSIKAQLGFTPEERIAQDIHEQMTPESLSVALDALSQEQELEKQGHADPERTVTIEVEYYHKDGSTRWIENILSGVRDERGVAIGLHGVSRDITERKKSEQDLKESFQRLRQSLQATVQAMAVTVEARDPYTAGHQRRAADLARAIAEEMGLSGEQIEGLYMAAKIHDIGKIAIPAEILNKPNRLTTVEFGLIKTHSQSGYDILKDIEFPWPIARMILEHHERIDGSGYPNGSTGDHLLPESRILSVADVVEAMASYRPYRPALGVKEALLEIERHAGMLYDPAAADACLRLFRSRGFQFEEIQ